MAERGIAKSRYVDLPKSAPNLFVWWRCMMQITGSAWNDDSRQVVEEDSAAYKRDVLGLVPSLETEGPAERFPSASRRVAPAVVRCHVGQQASKRGLRACSAFQQ